MRRPAYECHIAGLDRQLTGSLARAAAVDILLTMFRIDLSADKLPAFVPNCNDARRTTGCVGITI
jgi:hypothetical protein